MKAILWQLVEGSRIKKTLVFRLRVELFCFVTHVYCLLPPVCFIWLRNVWFHGERTRLPMAYFTVSFCRLAVLFSRTTLLYNPEKRFLFFFVYFYKSKPTNDHELLVLVRDVVRKVDLKVRCVCFKLIGLFWRWKKTCNFYSDKLNFNP